MLGIIKAIKELKDTYVSYQDLSDEARLIADIGVDAAAQAASTWEKTIFKAPFNCKVKKVEVIPDDTIGQATNYMTLDVQNKGAAGTGTTSIGSRNVNGSNTITKFVGVDLVTVDASVDEGCCLSLKKTVTLLGQIFPGGLVKVTYTRA